MFSFNHMVSHITRILQPKKGKITTQKPHPTTSCLLISIYRIVYAHLFYCIFCLSIMSMITLSLRVYGTFRLLSSSHSLIRLALSSHRPPQKTHFAVTIFTTTNNDRTYPENLILILILLIKYPS